MIERKSKEASVIAEKVAISYFKLIDETIRNYEESNPNADREALVKQIMTGIRMVKIDKESNLPVIINPLKSK